MSSVVVTVYTAGPSCQACNQTRRHLKARGIEFTEIPISSDPKIRDAARELGLTQAPIVCASVDGEETSWSGYKPDRIDALAEGA